MKYISLAFLACLFGFACCKGGVEENSKKNEVDVLREDIALASKQVVIPDSLRQSGDQKKIVEYTLFHFWDSYPFGLQKLWKSQLQKRRVGEYYGLLDYYRRIEDPNEEIQAFTDDFYTKIAADDSSFVYFDGQMNELAGDPNSPVRNEYIHIALLRSKIASPKTSETEKIRAEYRLKMCLLNPLGQKANNITAVLPGGGKVSLYDIKSDFTLLYLFNPGCSACKESTQGIVASEIITGALARGKLRVFALYPDQQEEAWRKYVSENAHKGWIHAWDSKQQIEEKKRYDLRAIPTFILLDGDKKVLVKDGTLAQIEEFLSVL